MIIDPSGHARESGRRPGRIELVRERGCRVSASTPLPLHSARRSIESTFVGSMADCAGFRHNDSSKSLRRNNWPVMCNRGA